MAGGYQPSTNKSASIASKSLSESTNCPPRIAVTPSRPRLNPPRPPSIWPRTRSRVCRRQSSARHPRICGAVTTRCPGTKIAMKMSSYRSCMVKTLSTQSSSRALTTRTSNSSPVEDPRPTSATPRRLMTSKATVMTTWLVTLSSILMISNAS